MRCVVLPRDLEIGEVRRVDLCQVGIPLAGQSAGDDGPVTLYGDAVTAVAARAHRATVAAARRAHEDGRAKGDPSGRRGDRSERSCAHLQASRSLFRRRKAPRADPPNGGRPSEAWQNAGALRIAPEGPGDRFRSAPPHTHPVLDTRLVA